MVIPNANDNGGLRQTFLQTINEPILLYSSN